LVDTLHLRLVVEPHVFEVGYFRAIKQTFVEEDEFPFVEFDLAGLAGASDRFSVRID
jgi:hypothetical protein